MTRSKARKHSAAAGALVARAATTTESQAQAQQIASLVDVVSLLCGAPRCACCRGCSACPAAAAAAPVASAGGGPATERPASGATRAASARGPSRRGGLPARVGDTSLRRSFVLSIPVARGANWFLAGGGRRMDEEEATAAAAERIAAAAEDGTSLPVRLATDVVRFLYGGTGRREPADGGVVSASLLNAKPAVGGIGVEPRGGGVLRVLFTVASDAVADTVVRWRHELRRCVDSTAVFDVLSAREEAQHQALWPAFLAAKVAGKRAQFHRARLVVDGERPNRPAVQAAFIEERIRPLAAGQTHLVLAGDFNFVESPRDRARSEGPLEWRDRTPAAAMAALVEDSPFRDAYRLIHPMQRGYTFSAYNAQARLDRLYVSMALVPRVLGCDAGESGGSDHRVVAMHLSPLVPESRGPGRPRVRAHFWADRDLADGFRAWFGREAAGAPTHGHTELMRWWQAFKPRLAREARRLDCDLGRRRDAVSVEVTRLRADLQRARAAVEAGRDGLAELAGLYALQRRLDAAVRRYALAPPACVRPGERVSGGMAAAFRKPAAARRVAALRDARGILVTDGRGMADIMADAVAAVSRPPPPSPADREAVLGAVRAHSPRVPQAVADAAGALVVTPAEVRAAATHSKPGTAPGPDGIPVDVWRKLGEPAFELLAAVFTAVGATGGTPPGFLDGVVASIYKAKNAADAANYRPFTMLGSDYRILAKVLATRWTPLLSAVVGPEQTAFLAGRRISDNICLTQMLPGLLAANAAEGVGPTGAALALLDFRKAYDTIDRGFLIAVLEAVGVGDGVLAWTRTILTHTYASAEVNGFIFAPRKYAAGVRQGCPAAPALFLFLGHALACFLRTCPAVGVEVVPGCRVTCPQYADDCMPLLRSCAPADVAALVETMAVFGRATGLVLNLGKCGILPLGSAGEGLLAGAEVAGLRVLDAGVSLGVPVSAGLPPPEGVTGVCRERLAAAYTKLARFPMSAFGRGHAAATYGVSRILFRAVHCGMTPEAERVLSRWTATVVDRSVGPDPPAELPRWASSVPGERAAVVEILQLVGWKLPSVFAGLRGLEAAVPTLWRMPLLNARKEPIWRLWPPARSVAVERAGELATMDLWDALASFAEGGGMPRGWAGVVGPTHPFVGVVDGGLTLNKTS
ncbi:hypothetical protein FOA52_006073 [Chlamydomonas sp. UWO 241]|nr:hypothetical protein FOA52_006073 [Chlamydomonas sp. UWO 241]